MSNILVTKLYRLENNTGWPSHRAEEYYANYNEMLNIMVDGANQHVADLSDVVISTGEKQNIQHAFLDHFLEIHDLWKQGHNILYCDVDIVFLQSYQVFEKFSHFSMFNYTAPRSTVDQYYNVQLPNFFNCAVRYYPANMPDSVWQIGLNMIDRGWNHARWDTEQVIYNCMMWSQNINIHDVLRPHLNWQAFGLPAETNSHANQAMHIQEASAIHFSGSRGSQRVNEMRRVQSLYSRKQ
jgi:hypothetical protein